MKKHLPRILSLLALALGLGSTAPAAAGQADFVFDFSKAHNYMGIGAQVWPWGNKEHMDAVAQMLRDMNARFVRVSIGGKIPDDQAVTDQSVEQYLAIIEANDTPKQQQNFTYFRDRMNGLGIGLHLISWMMPKNWMIPDGKNPNFHHVDRRRINDYANLMVAQLIYLKNLGINPVAIELTNEPHGAWNCKYDPQSYAELVLTARRTMDSYGFTRIKIDGPGTNVQNFDAFYSALRQSGSAKYIDFLSTHIYVTPDKLLDTSAPEIAEFLGRGSLGPIIATEYGVKAHDPGQPGYEGDSDVSSPGYALEAAATSLVILGDGANSLFYWEAADSDFTKKQHGLLTLNNEKRPVALALQSLFGHVPADALTVGGIGTTATLPAQAFLKDGDLYLMVVNNNRESQNISARFAGLPHPRTRIVGDDVYTSGGDIKSAVSRASLQNGVFSATIAPETVATILLR